MTLTVSYPITSQCMILIFVRKLLSYRKNCNYFFEQFYQIWQSTTSIGAMHRMGVDECLFLIDF